MMTPARKTRFHFLVFFACCDRFSPQAVLIEPMFVLIVSQSILLLVPVLFAWQQLTVLLFNKFDTKLKAFPFRCGGGSSAKRDCGEGLADVSAWDVMRDWLVVCNMAFIFPYSVNNHPNWLIFFRGVETTNPETIMRFRDPRVEFLMHKPDDLRHIPMWFCGVDHKWVT